MITYWPDNVVWAPLTGPQRDSAEAHGRAANGRAARYRDGFATLRSAGLA